MNPNSELKRHKKCKWDRLQRNSVLEETNGVTHPGPLLPQASTAAISKYK